MCMSVEMPDNLLFQLFFLLFLAEPLVLLVIAVTLFGCLGTSNAGKYIYR